jgi:hypothetical protein
VYHNRGTAVRCDAAKQEETPSKEIVGLEYVKHLRAGKSDELVSATFDGNEVTTFLLLAGATGTEVRIGDGVGASVADRVPMAMVTRRGKRAQFAAVIEPARKGQHTSVNGIEMVPDGTGVRVSVWRGEGLDSKAMSDIITIDAAGKVGVRRGDKVILGGK